MSMSHTAPTAPELGPPTDRSGPDPGADAPDRGREAAAAARAFFDRPAPDDYLDEWARRLAEPEPQADHEVLSVVIFRLHAEWLALTTDWLVEITDLVPVHTIPHRTDAVLLGLVNIRGQLRLCVSLHGLLEVDPPDDGAPAVRLAVDEDGLLRTPYRRMILLRDGTDEWVFPAEEVLKVDLLARAELRQPPSTFLPGSTRIEAVFAYHGRTVGLLDAPGLFTALRSHCR